MKKAVFGFLLCCTVMVFFVSCKSIGVNADYVLPIVKQSGFEKYPYGGFGFGAALDTKYTQFNFDFYPFVKEGPDTQEASKMNYSFYLKYPFELGKTTLSPMLGLDMGFGGLAVGAGLDVPVGEHFSFHTEALYDFGPLNAFAQAGSMFFRAGFAYNFKTPQWFGSTTQSQRSPEFVDLMAKSSGLVFDAGRSLGMTIDELRVYWSRAELLELGDDLCSIIGYPALVATSMFFFDDGKVSAVNYSFGNYNAVAELNLMMAYIERFGSPAGKLSDGASYWIVQASGVMIFSLGKEVYPDAESGYILTLVCSRPE